MKPHFLSFLFFSALITPSLTFGQDGAPALASPGVELQTTDFEAAVESAEELDFVARSEFIIERIASNARQVDPFGMPMDPTNTVETNRLADQYDELEDAPVITNSALKNALQTLPITGVYPAHHSIVLGARTFKRGGIFGMKLEELTIRLRFEGVKGTSLYFKDLDTQEVATVEFNTLPAEFEPITSQSVAPRGKGIVPMDELYIAN